MVERMTGPDSEELMMLMAREMDEKDLMSLIYSGELRMNIQGTYLVSCSFCPRILSSLLSEIEFADVGITRILPR